MPHGCGLALTPIDLPLTFLALMNRVLDRFFNLKDMNCGQ